MLSPEEAQEILTAADEICSAVVVSNAVTRLADEITKSIGDTYPLVLSVMGGAVVFTGQLLPLLRFPLDFDYIHASRYGNDLSGADITWKVLPSARVDQRTVLVLDDILDHGVTMAAIRERVLALGARQFYCAVLADKTLNIAKPVAANFIGLTLPNRFVFGYGMDVHGAWRNLPAIYAVNEKTNA